MNSVILIGRLARNPEISYSNNQNQTAVTRFTLAVDRPKTNGKDNGADFIKVIVFGKQAETCERYLFKGKQCAVQGRINTSSYKNKNGETVYTTDIIAERVEFLGSANSTPKPRAEQEQRTTYEGTQASFEDLPDTFSYTDDDIPF